MHQYLKRGFVELVFQVIYVEVGMSICACYHLKCISHSVWGGGGVGGHFEGT